MDKLSFARFSVVRVFVLASILTFVPLKLKAASEIFSFDTRYVVSLDSEFEKFPDFHAIEQFILEYSGLKQTALRALQFTLGKKSILENILLMGTSAVINTFFDTRAFIIPFHELGHARIAQRLGCENVALVNGGLAYDNFFSYLGANILSPLSLKGTSFSSCPPEHRIAISAQGINNNVAIAQAYANSLQMGTGSVYEAFNYFFALTYPLNYADTFTRCGEGNDFCQYGLGLSDYREPPKCVFNPFDIGTEDEVKKRLNVYNACLQNTADGKEKILAPLREDVFIGTMISLFLSSSSWFYALQIANFIVTGDDRVKVYRPFGLQFPDVVLSFSPIGMSFDITSSYYRRLPSGSWMSSFRVPLGIGFVPDERLGRAWDMTIGLDLYDIKTIHGFEMDISFHVILGQNYQREEEGNLGANVLLSIGVETPWFFTFTLGYQRYDPHTLYGYRHTPLDEENRFWGRLSLNYGKIIEQYGLLPRKTYFSSKELSSKELSSTGFPVKDSIEWEDDD